MTKLLSNFEGVALVQFPEQIPIFKEYFLNKAIKNDKILWIAITETALLFLEKETLQVAKITDFYNYTTFNHYIFEKSYESLGEILKRLDKEIYSYYPVFKKYDMVFSQFSFYFLRLWCDSIELRIYELASLKKALGDFLNVYYVSFEEPPFSYPNAPYHTNHSLDFAITSVFKDKELIKAGYYNPIGSFAGYKSEFESKEILRQFKKSPTALNLILKYKLFLQRIISRKNLLCINIQVHYFYGKLKNFCFLPKIPQNDIETPRTAQSMVNSILSPNDFEILGVSFKEYYKKIIITTLNAFLKETLNTINFYKKNPSQTWESILSTGFNTFGSMAIAKIFKSYKKKVYCLHHGSHGIIKDKINAYLEYPFITDYFVWGEGVTKQIKKEGDWNNLNIHSVGSAQVDFLKEQILNRKRKIFSKKSSKPIIVYLLQAINDGVRVTLDHPPGLIDFSLQKDFIQSLLNIKSDFDLILKAHPSHDGYHSALRFLFKEDKRVHYVSSLPLENFLIKATHFITDRPSTSLIQAMSCGLKSYCLINSDFYIKNFKKSLKEDNVLFENSDTLVKTLHKDLLNWDKTKQSPTNPYESSSFLKNYANPFNDTLSYKRILNAIKE
ncbi:MAG: hypothetical protein JSS34_01765 [Proteobacteria bacterium]|nr:hypothetical protein [Pseudomonadota bacterium]